MRPRDAACQLLLAFPGMVRDLLGGFVLRTWIANLVSPR